MNAPDELRDGSRAAGWLNKLLAFVKMTRIVEGVGYRLIQTTRGTALEIQPGKGGGAPATVSRYRVESVQNDHLVCKKVEGSGVSTDETLIAKPYHLRRTGWHGSTFTYPLEPYPTAPLSLSIVYEYLSPVYRLAKVTTDAGSVDEHQVIIQRYMPGVTEIKAMEIGGGTGVIQDAAELTLEDMNQAGRSWARVA